MAGVAHLTEAGDKEVVAAVIRWGVFLDVGKLHKLGEKKEGVSPEGMTTKIFLKFLSKPANICGLQQRGTGLFTTAARRVLRLPSCTQDMGSPSRNVPPHSPTELQQHPGPAADAANLTTSPTGPCKGHLGVQRSSELEIPNMQHTLVTGDKFAPSFFRSSQMAQNPANISQTLLQG